MSDDLLGFLDNLEPVKPAAPKAASPVKPAGAGSAAPPSPAAPPKEEKEKEDPILDLRVGCPICTEEGIHHYELKAKSLAVILDRFCVPLYRPTPKYKMVDYNLITVTVCPSCLFASPDRRDFAAKSGITGKVEKSQLQAAVIADLQNLAQERKALYKELKGSPNLFDRARSAESAILSYRLAVLRADNEIKHKVPYANFKRGFYWVKIAHLEKRVGRPVEVQEKSLAEALASYQTAFTQTDFPNEDLEYQTAYSLAAILIRLKQEKEGMKFVSALDKYRADIEQRAKKNPAVNTAFIKKWLGIAREMWERKDEPEYWEVK
ncbi:MAG: DUF2225 domain-containing protein [Spirochaetia bacterium]|nr:DUF2225 domain-containing protein [Spirochaetia bacterium]